jgi:hypothetical protein
MYGLVVCGLPCGTCGIDCTGQQVIHFTNLSEASLLHVPVAHDPVSRPWLPDSRRLGFGGYLYITDWQSARLNAEWKSVPMDGVIEFTIERSRGSNITP